MAVWEVGYRIVSSNQSEPACGCGGFAGGGGEGSVIVIVVVVVVVVGGGGGGGGGGVGGAVTDGWMVWQTGRLGVVVKVVARFLPPVQCVTITVVVAMIVVTSS
ncbi:unnamed protein product, partial [Hydatigera taeniaeformis]|uniref:Transmembrane protein n=1 Tax=Hydatigena taeniaeformis TaxID=6205 RepID=A0A0R3WXN0_HYDTA